jgi:hypothetical protein
LHEKRQKLSIVLMLRPGRGGQAADVESGTRLLQHKPSQAAAINAACKRLSTIDLYWREKAWMLLDTLQIYALLWSLSQPWPWPYVWLRRTRWTLVANLDIMGLSAGGAGMGSTAGIISVWGERSGYLFYAAAFGLVPAVMCILWAFRVPLMHPHAASYCWNLHKSCLNWGQRAFEAAIIVSSNVLLLPVGYAVCRLWICSGGVLMADPAVVCGSVQHTLVASIATAVYAVSTGLLLQLMNKLSHQVRYLLMHASTLLVFELVSNEDMCYSRMLLLELFCSSEV